MNMKNSKRILSVNIKRMIDDSPDTSHLGEYANHSTSQFSIDRAHSEDCASVDEKIQDAKRTLEHVQQTIGDMHNAVLAQYNGTLANEKLDLERDTLSDAYDEVGSLFDSIDDCNCQKQCPRNEFRYFNPSFNYVTKEDKPADGLTPEDVRKYVRQDYERMERLNSGDWCYIGIKAEAEVCLGSPRGFTSNGKPVYTCQTIQSGGLWGTESDSEESYLKSIEKEELDSLKTELLALGFSKRAIATAFKNVEEISE